MYAVSAPLSEGCTPGGGRLHTCYSPVRRSPAGRASASPAAPRLACVKPAASVHPEPGSNSPLFYVSVLRRICRIVRPGLPVLSRAPLNPPPEGRRGSPAASFVLWHRCQCPWASRRTPAALSGWPRSRFASAKLRPFSGTRKLSTNFFRTFLLRHSQNAVRHAFSRVLNYVHLCCGSINDARAPVLTIPARRALPRLLPHQTGKTALNSTMHIQA